MDAALARGLIRQGSAQLRRTRGTTFGEFADLVEKLATPLIKGARLADVGVVVAQIERLLQARLKPIAMRRVDVGPTLGRPNSRGVFLEFYLAGTIRISLDNDPADPWNDVVEITWTLIEISRRRIVVTARQCGVKIAGHTLEQLLTRSGERFEPRVMSPLEHLGRGRRL